MQETQGGGGKNRDEVQVVRKGVDANGGDLVRQESERGSNVASLGYHRNEGRKRITREKSGDPGGK